MKAHKKIKQIVMAVMLAATVLIIDAMPVLAEEGDEQITETVDWNKYEPNNELIISTDTSENQLIAGKMTANNPMVIWSKNSLTTDEQKYVWNSLKGNPGVGNPKEIIFVDGDGASAYGMTIDSEKGTVRFDGKNNWALLYAGKYVKTNAQPEPEIVPKSEETPGTETVPGSEETPKPEETPKSEEIPEQGKNQEPEKKQEPKKTPEAGPAQDVENIPSKSGSNSGGSRVNRSGSGSPGMVRVLDNQPETGLIDIIEARQLDEVPKTGLPTEYIILLIASAVSLIALAITLIIEKKSGMRNNNN